jgi:TolA-binding protein
MIKRTLFASLILIGISFCENIILAAETDTSVDKLIADYINNANMASKLVDTAGQCAWDRKYDDAERLYLVVIDNHPNNTFTTKAQLGLARVDILNLIEKKEYSAAREKVDFIVANFKDEPETSVAMFHIGQEFSWQHMYYESKYAFDSLINKFPSTSCGQRAKIWSRRVEICSLIKQRDREKVLEATDRLIQDFKDNQELAETLQWIANESEWTEGFDQDIRQDEPDWFDIPIKIYQKSSNEIENKRLSLRSKILISIKENNQEQTNFLIKQMIEEFSGSAKLPDELTWVANGYEERGKLTETKEILQKLITMFPESSAAKDAKPRIKAIDIWEQVKTENMEVARILINQFVMDFNQNSNAGRHLNEIALKCYSNSWKEESRDIIIREKWLNRAIEIWTTVAEKMPTSPSETPNAYLSLGRAYRDLGKYEQAVGFLKEIVENWKDYKYYWEADKVLSECLERSGSK